MKKLEENKYYINRNTGTIKKGKKWLTDCLDLGESSELWGIRDPFDDLEQVKSKAMQIRVPYELYEKIREKAYLQRKSLQSIVTELFEREFEK